MEIHTHPCVFVEGDGERPPALWGQVQAYRRGRCTHRSNSLCTRIRVWTHSRTRAYMRMDVWMYICPNKVTFTYACIPLSVYVHVHIYILPLPNAGEVLPPNLRKTAFHSYSAKLKFHQFRELKEHARYTYLCVGPRTRIYMLYNNTFYTLYHTIDNCLVYYIINFIHKIIHGA